MVKILLSGAPCSGKTTLFDAIPRNDSFVFIPEVARIILSSQPHLKTESNFQEQLLREQLRLEKDAENSGALLIICDRGYLDTIAYSRFFGHPVNNELISQFSPYNIVFQTSIEGIPPVDEYATEEGFLERRCLDKIFHSLFQEMHIPLIELKGTPEKRLNDFLNHIQNQFNVEGISFTQEGKRREEKNEYKNGLWITS